MAEGTYEYELERAELLGVTPMNRATWEEQNKMRKEVEEEEIQNATLEELESEGEKLKGGAGKFEELNSILSLTQLKLNKFKNVCGSMTTLLKLRGSPAPERKNPGGEGTSAEDNKNDINDALDNLEQMKEHEAQSDIQFVKQDINTKITSHLGALDSLINKAEMAQNSMAAQNKQMKSYLQ